MSNAHLIAGTTEQVVESISDKIIMDIFNHMKSVSEVEANLFLQLMTLRLCRNVMDELGNEAFVKLWNVIDESYREVIKLEDIQSGKRKADA